MPKRIVSSGIERRSAYVIRSRSESLTVDLEAAREIEGQIDAIVDSNDRIA